MAYKVEISVLISAFNQEKYIARCLRSLINQTFNHEKFEIIIVNDGSSDRTLFVAELFKSPKNSFIKIINNKKNLGLPSSLNKAINLSKGKYIVRIDSDDWVSNDFLKLLYTYLDNNNYMDAVACDYQFS